MDVDDLYGLPLDEFVPQRGALGKALRADKRREEAAEVAALRKPSIAAWAVNQLVRTQHDAVQALFEAGDGLRGAQEDLLAGRGDGRKLRAANEREREAVDTLVEAARGLLTSGGYELSAAVVERVDDTLHAAALDEEARDQVRDGRLERELRHAGIGLGFGEALAATPVPRAAKRADSGAAGAEKKGEPKDGEAGKGEAGKGAAGKGAAGKGTAGKGTAGKGAAGKGTAGEGETGKGAARKGPATGRSKPGKADEGETADAKPSDDERRAERERAAAEREQAKRAERERAEARKAARAAETAARRRADAAARALEKAERRRDEAERRRDEAVQALSDADDALTAAREESEEAAAEHERAQAALDDL